jgi:hypothetical protein
MRSKENEFPNLLLLPEPLAFEFFWKFAAFECALKRAKFRTVSNDTVTANWDKFGSDYEAVALQTPSFRRAMEALVQLNPLCQTVNEEDELDWRPVRRGNDNEVQFALRLLRTIRNNLFHGGKYARRPMKEVARDERLLSAGIDVLHECYRLDKQIQSHIQDIVQLAA